MCEHAVVMVSHDAPQLVLTYNPAWPAPLQP
jgi:hypothetical protein